MFTIVIKNNDNSVLVSYKTDIKNFNPDTPELNDDAFTVMTVEADPEHPAGQLSDEQKQLGLDLQALPTSIAAVRAYAQSAGLQMDLVSPDVTYTLEVGEALGLAVSSVAATTVTLDWDEVEDADSYNVRYRLLTGGAWTSTTASTNTKNITGLTAGTEYEFQIQSVVTDGDTSPFTPSFEWIQLCAVPTGLATDSFDVDGVVVMDWAVMTGAATYKLRYRKTGDTPWIDTVTGIETNEYELTGLDEGIGYDVQIAAVNASGSTAFTSTVTALTIAATPANLTVGTIADTTAVSNWDDTTGAASYAVRYRIVGAGSWTSTTATPSTKNLTGLTAASDYEIQVAAVNASGTSDYTASTLFTTTA